MMTPDRLKEFDSAMIANAQSFFDKELHVPGDNPSSLFHYTKPDAAKSIVDDQIFRASFIRATSDLTEFEVPMQGCRDWFCIDQEILKYPDGVPKRLYELLTAQANEPDLRPYFISLCEKGDSDHLRSEYGEETLHLSLPKKFTGTDFPPNLIKCRYVEDPAVEARKLLSSWRREYFQKVIESFPDIDLSKRETSNYWFPNMMQIFFGISLSLKYPKYKDEEESRLLLFTDNPAIKKTWHLAEVTEKAEKEGDREKVYLPIKVNALQITIERV